MLKITCDRCKAELQNKDLAAEVCIALAAFAQGNRKGNVMQYELCPRCVARVISAIENTAELKI